MRAWRLSGLAVGMAIIVGVWLWLPGPRAKPESTAKPAVGKIRSIQDACGTKFTSRGSATTQPVAEPLVGIGRGIGVGQGGVDEERLKALKEGVAESDIPAALRFLQEQPDVGRVRDLIVQLVRQWAENGVKDAAAWAERMPAGGARPEALKGVAILWANQDLAEAIRWARQLPEGGERDSVLRSVAYEAARTEPLAAMEIAIGLPANPERDALVQHAALQWAASAPATAAEWGDQIPDDALRERVLSHIATARGEKDPVVAAQFAVLAIAPGKPQDDAVVGIVQRWVQKDPEAAARWVTGFPDGVLRETAAENVIRLWPGGRPEDSE